MWFGALMQRKPQNNPATRSNPVAFFVPETQRQITTIDKVITFFIEF